jgi:phosphoribosylaminoimidazole-succinocarboxamide synthase
MSQHAASDVVVSTDLPGLPPFIRGKVRDVYDLGDRLLIVTTDRISAYDSILPNGIPGKGRVLTQLSAFWFERFGELCPNHCLTVDSDAIAAEVRGIAAEVETSILAGRSMLTRKTQALPVECVVRGYLDGSGWKEYRQNGTVCGISLPAGLQQGSRLPEPIFTPATKAHEGHDINITHAQMAELVDPAVMAEAMRLSLAVYNAASEYAAERGIIIADTKFEFGVLDGGVMMIDECLTPDSSRFWDAATWQPGGAQASFDKQFVRDYLDSCGWDHNPPPPPLPDDVVEKTAAKYRELFVRITGRDPD